MNLRKLMFWNHTQPAAAAPLAAPSTAITANRDNVIAMPMRDAAAADSAPPMAASTADGSIDVARPANKAQGIWDTPELKAFFANNYFGLGQHNGMHFRTQDALQQGRSGVISRFRNVLAALIEQRQNKLDQIVDMGFQIAGQCEATSAGLDIARARYERDIALLNEQMALSQEHKGWVLEALNRYQVGFGDGVRKAIAFELAHG